MGDDRPAVYREGDDWIIRASALGGCMRSLVAAGRDVEPQMTPEWLQAKFDQGHDGEREVAGWYLKNHAPDGSTFMEPGEFSDQWLKNFTYENDQWAFDWRVAPGIIIRGHFDDILMVPTDDGGFDFIGVEYKLLAPSTYAKATGSAHLDVIPQYPWQMGAYMAVTGWPFDWVCMEKDEDGKPLLTEGHQHVVRLNADYPPISRQQLIDRAVEVIDWIENKDYGEYPACPDPLPYPCSYFILHDEVEIPELEGVDAELMRGVLGHITAAKKNIEDMKHVIEESNAIIKRTLGDRKTVMLDGTRITWVHTETPEKWITPKPYMKKASVTDYPKITPPKDRK